VGAALLKPGLILSPLWFKTLMSPLSHGMNMQSLSCHIRTLVTCLLLSLQKKVSSFPPLPVAISSICNDQPRALGLSPLNFCQKESSGHEVPAQVPHTQWWLPCVMMFASIKQWDVGTLVTWSSTLVPASSKLSDLEYVLRDEFLDEWVNKQFLQKVNHLLKCCIQISGYHSPSLLCRNHLQRS
jgi:hypothetical protein